MSKYRHAKKAGLSKVLMIALIAVVSVGIIIGGVFAVKTMLESNEPTQETIATKAPTKAVATEPQTEPPTEDPMLKYTNLAKDYMKNMTDDEKIYQLLMVSPESLTGVDVATVAGETTKEALTEKNVGGIIYAEQNFDKTEITDMIKNTKSYAKYPLFIAVCEQGGENSPVANALGTTKIDPNAKPENSSTSKATADATTISKDIAKFGFNLNIAPAANIDESNPNMKDADSAGKYVSDAVKAYQDNSIIPAIGMYPIAKESSKAYTEMKDSDFVPFATAIENGADVIMVSSYKATSIDNTVPVFMSGRMVSELFNKDLNFNGLVLSPVLTDENITSNYTTDEIVVNSIKAGVNMFVCPADIDEYVEAIKTAHDEKLITQEQIDNCVEKILAIKFKYGIITKPSTPPTDAVGDATQSETSTETEITTQPATEASTQTVTTA